MERGRERILAGIRKRAEWMAAGHFRTPPPNPYKRSDYRQVWQSAFDSFTRNIEEALEKLATGKWQQPD